MSKIQSASTVSLTAYLTSFGKSVFLSYGGNNGQVRFVQDPISGLYVDRFQVTSFSLYDTDTNYKTTSPLESGDVPAMSGKKNSVNKTLSSNKRLIL